MPPLTEAHSTALRTLLRADAPQDQVRTALQALDQAQAWNGLVAAAKAHAVAPLLHDALLPYADKMPAETLRQLYESRLETAVANMLLLRELQHILRRLAAGDIEPLILKGVAAAQELYGDAVLRPMGDLDLLVRGEQAAAAGAALAELGYVRHTEEVLPGADRAFESQMALERRDERTGFCYFCELHWHLLDSPYHQRAVSLDWFWETAVRLRADGLEIMTLGAEAGLLYLCAHAALHHREGRLLWICDVDRAVRRGVGTLDWDLVVERAQAYDLLLPLRDVLDRAADWLGAPVPEEVQARLNRLHPSPTEERVFSRLTAGRRPVARRFRDDLASLSGWRRLRYAFINLFPSPTYMRWRYDIPHPLLVPLYYPYRWWLGLRSALRARAG